MTKEDSFEIFWNTNPIGDKRSVILLWGSIVNVAKFKGKIITGEWLAERYIKYVESLKPYQHGQYTKGEYRILVPEKWLMNKGWNIEPIKFKDPLDFYLYGITDSR